MDKLKIDRSDNTVVFGQLLGMCDHISFTLGKTNCSMQYWVWVWVCVWVCVCVFGGVKDQKEFGISVRKEKVKRVRGVCRRQ